MKKNNLLILSMIISLLFTGCTSNVKENQESTNSVTTPEIGISEKYDSTTAVPQLTPVTSGTPAPEQTPTSIVTPNPSPTVSVNPTPAPSVKPAATPNPSPTGSVSPTPAPSVKPTPTPNPSPVVSASPTPIPSVNPTPIPKPSAINLTLTGYFGDYLDNMQSKISYEEWISKEYGIDFNFKYPERDRYSDFIKQAISTDDLSGLVGLFTPQEVKEWASNGWIYPLSDFLKDNYIFNNNVPEFWKEAYTFDGELWGISRGDDGNKSIFVRSIRGDWLEALGLSKPQTVDELYQASYKFTYNDPDRNGKNDTFGMTSRTTWLMQDIFQAYDARLNHTGEALPVWNPNINLWEDSMIKPEMVKCLELLQKMTAENVLDKETFIHSATVARGKVQSGYYGGMFYWDTWVQAFESRVKSVFPNAWMDSIYALKGKISTNINQYGTGLSVPYTMTLTTPEPKETINWFVDIFFGSAEGVFRGRYGIQGEVLGEGMFTLSGNKVYLNYFINNGKIAGYGAPSIIGGHPDYALGTVYEVVYNSPNEAWNEFASNKTNNSIIQNKKWFDEALAWSGLYFLPESLKEPSSKLYLNIRDQLSLASQEAISKSMTGEISVSDAIANYRSTAKALGAQEVLNSANQEINQITKQKY